MKARKILALLAALLLAMTPMGAVRAEEPAGSPEPESQKPAEPIAPLIRAIRTGEVEQVKAILTAKPALARAKDPLGLTALHWAAQEGEPKIASLLLASGALPNAKTAEGMTPLHEAVFWGHPNLVTLLLRKKAAVNATTTEGITPLHLAAKGGSLRIADRLLANGAKVNATANDGLTPLHLAVRGGSLQMVDLLLAKGANVKAATRRRGRTSLHMARSKAVAKRLLAEGADIHALTRYRLTPLHLADNAEVATFLLAKGAKLGAMDGLGRLPIHWAAARGRADVIAVLIARGAKVEAKDQNGSTPLLVAAHAALGTSARRRVFVPPWPRPRFVARGGMDPRFQIGPDYPLLKSEKFAEVARTLVDHGADIDGKDRNYRTVLHMAAVRQSAAVIKRLLALKAKVNITDQAGYTPLHLAYGLDGVKLLVAGGADIYAKAKGGATPLHSSLSIRAFDAAKFLVAQGAKLDDYDAFGYTPLHWAVQNQSLDLFELLLSKGADPKTVSKGSKFTLLHLARNAGIAERLLALGLDIQAADRDGYTPLLWAVQRQNLEMFELLLSKGAGRKIVRKGNKGTLLHLAWNAKVAKRLLALGLDIQATDSAGYTALHRAVQRESKELLQLLIARGADVKVATTSKGMTALHLAVQGRLDDLAAVLLAKGAEVNATDHSGLTPLHYAIGWSNSEMLELLLAEGADPTITTTAGETALHLAVRSGRHNTVQLVLLHAKRIDVNAKDKKGQTPLHLAALRRNKAVYDLLVSKGGNINLKGNDGRTAAEMWKKPIPEDRGINIRPMESNIIEPLPSDRFGGRLL